ncbi:hypothetical protein GUJ93_ZPchr0019g2664 [Zizania palustris]|uniref:Uncharacterized protein n=1 Tax=Zizania palustris TaxID=103762 RepID=A0A8J5TKL6_ZIZPA|nr:hypothetical protein GUJ93_ZPchr0019g2664 [Zizania palustris]
MVPTMCKESAVTGASGDGEHYSWLIRELCALLVTIISPTPRQARGIARSAPSPGVSPAAAASMLLGASMALMLCGSVTFAIGFLLMPWVAGVTLLFGFVGAVSALSAAYKDATRGRVSSPTSPASLNSDKTSS